MRARSTLAFAVLFFASQAIAGGYGPWQWGMGRDEVRAVKQHGPYYDFKNADIGTQNGPFEGKRLPTSFYFEQDKLKRVMVILYAGPDYDAARSAWRGAFQHIAKNFKAAEVRAVRAGPTDLKSAVAALDASGLREGRRAKLQMGATPMPPDRIVWCSIDKPDPNTFFVTLNYAAP